MRKLLIVICLISCVALLGHAGEKARHNSVNGIPVAVNLSTITAAAMFTNGGDIDGIYYDNVSSSHVYIGTFTFTYANRRTQAYELPPNRTATGLYVQYPLYLEGTAFMYGLAEIVGGSVDLRLLIQQ